MEKKYQIFERVLDSQAKSGKFPWIQDGKWLICYITEKYSKTHKERSISSYLIYYWKIFVYLYVLLLIVLSFQTINSQPSLPTLIEHMKACIADPIFPECKNWKNPLESSDESYRNANYKTWTLYTNTLYYLLIVTYFPYSIWWYIKQFKLWDISLLYSLWKVVCVYLFIFWIIPFTWEIWAFLWSAYIYLYISYFVIPFKFFWTFSIPWIL